MHDNRQANHLGAFWALLDRRLDAVLDGLSRSTGAALLTLRYRGPLTTTGLARIIGLSQPACARLVDKLVADGLVAKFPRKTGKEVDLWLSRAGRRVADDLQERRLAAQEDLLAGLQPAERTAFTGLVAKLLGAHGADNGGRDGLCRFCDHDLCHGTLCPLAAAGA